MSAKAAVEQVSRIVAQASAEVLTRLSGSPATASEVTVDEDAAEALTASSIRWSASRWRSWARSKEPTLPDAARRMPGRSPRR